MYINLVDKTKKITDMSQILNPVKHFINKHSYLEQKIKSTVNWALLPTDQISFSFLVLKIRTLMTGISQFHFQTKMYFVVFVFFSHFQPKTHQFLAKNVLRDSLQSIWQQPSKRIKMGHVSDFHCNCGWLVSLLHEQHIIKHAFCYTGVDCGLKFKQWPVVSRFTAHQIRCDAN